MTTQKSQSRTTQTAKRPTKKRVSLLEELRIPARAIAFAREIGEDPENPNMLQMIACGLHSGFPKCCVLFFVTVWMRLWAFDSQAVIAAYHAARDAMGLKNAGYVMCPACILSGNVVRVKKCDCNARLQTLWPKINRAARRAQARWQATKPSVN